MSWYTRESLKSYRNDWIEHLRTKIGEYANDDFKNFAMALTGLAVVIITFLVLDFLIKKMILFFVRKLIQLTMFKWDQIFYENKFFNSIAHLIATAIIRSLIPFVLYSTPGMLAFTDKMLSLVIVLVVLQLLIRTINAILDIATDENNYKTVAVRTFGQLFKILCIFFASLVIVSLLLNVEFNKIITGLGAATAILILIFRDTILGFVSGVQIASTQMIKVGDWISIPKFNNLEGTIKEINLMSAKIENFDKTISFVPTYDLVSSEVKNYEAMRQSNTRRIKRSIIFNIKSFEFCDEEMLNKFKRYNLIRSYIEEKEKEINEENLLVNQDAYNGRSLTNIGVFRIYVKNYLQKHPMVSLGLRDTLVVRQLEITPQGLPLEVFCFVKTVEFVQFEEVQADIFDHLLTVSKEFNLEVMQILTA